MLWIIRITFCFFVLTGVESTDERLKELERLVLDQGESIRQLKTSVHQLEIENRGLKSSVYQLENEGRELKSSVHQLETENKELKFSVDRLKNENHNLKNRVKHLEDNVVPQSKAADTLLPSDKPEQIKTDAEVAPTTKFKHNDGQHTNKTYTKRQSLGTANVAFHVYLSANTCLRDHEVIVYNVEEIDDGNGYNEYDGIYTIPVSGVYMFTWTSYAPSTQYVVTYIIVNGAIKGSSMADSSLQSLLISTSTGLTVLRVNAGDHVFIRRGDGRGCIMKSDNVAKSTFSGWLLYA